MTKKKKIVIGVIVLIGLAVIGYVGKSYYNPNEVKSSPLPPGIIVNRNRYKLN